MSGIALLADRHTVTCFKLAGLKNAFVFEKPQDAKKRLLELLNDNQIRIILVSERLLSKLEILDEIVTHKYPIIIPIPDLKGPKPLKVDFIAEIIRRKTGIEVKF